MPVSLEDEAVVSLLSSISNLLSADDIALLAPSLRDDVLPCDVVFALSSFLLPQPTSTREKAMHSAAKHKHNFFILTAVPFIYFINIFGKRYSIYSNTAKFKK